MEVHQGKLPFELLIQQQQSYPTSNPSYMSKSTVCDVGVYKSGRNSSTFEPSFSCVNDPYIRQQESLSQSWISEGELVNK